MSDGDPRADHQQAKTKSADRQQAQTKSADHQKAPVKSADHSPTKVKSVKSTDAQPKPKSIESQLKPDKAQSATSPQPTQETTHSASTTAQETATQDTVTQDQEESGESLATPTVSISSKSDTTKRPKTLQEECTPTTNPPPSSYTPDLGDGLLIITLVVAVVLRRKLKDWKKKYEEQSRVLKKSRQKLKDSLKAGKKASLEAMSAVWTEADQPTEDSDVMTKEDSSELSLNEVSAFTEILDRRDGILMALELHEVWADVSELHDRALLLLSSINEARLKRLHDQMSQRCLREHALDPASRAPEGYGLNDEAWVLFEWVLNVYNLSLSTSRQIKLSTFSVGDTFDRKQMKATQDVMGGSVASVLLPGLPALKLKAIVEL